MKIGIIGPYPPPYGGRSIHVQRLVDFISRTKEFLFKLNSLIKISTSFLENSSLK